MKKPTTASTKPRRTQTDGKTHPDLTVLQRPSQNPWQGHTLLCLLQVRKAVQGIVRNSGNAEMNETTCPYCKTKPLGTRHNAKTCGGMPCVWDHKKHLRAVNRAKDKATGRVYPSGTKRKTEIICKRCGEKKTVFSAQDNPKRKLCNDCLKPQPKPAKAPRYCKTCGIYIGTARNKSYCAVHSKSHRNIKTRNMVVACQTCGEEFTKSDRYRKYCSDDCAIQGKVKLRRQAERNRGYSVSKRLRSTMTVRLRKMLLSAIGNDGGAGRLWKNVSYTPKQLQKHLEGLFEPEMTWDNYGAEWHIDHIVPCSKFQDLTPGTFDFYQCWSLDNLMPRWATTAIAKSHGSNQIGNIEKSNKVFAVPPQGFALLAWVG